MSSTNKSWKFLPVVALSLFFLPAVTRAQHYIQTDLVSNVPVPGQTPLIDANLQNAWGLVASPTSPWWVSNNAGGTSTLYAIDAAGTAHLVPINPDGFVQIPNAPGQTPPGSPTGVMFNGSPTDFFFAPGKRAVFIFATEDGTIQAWPGAVDANGNVNAVIVVDHSKVPNAANGAVYKGATIAEIDGKKFILAANFRSGRVDVFDTNFKQMHLEDDAFDDDRIPRDFAPFNVQGVGPNIYVTYAKQDAPKHDPVNPGEPGDGFVDVFSSHGRLLQRFEHGPWFNAPWGVVWAIPNFGEFSNTILIGNFRGGNISAFNPVTGRFLGNMLNPDGTTLNIGGLWALRFGNSDGSKNAQGNLKSNAGSALTLFFTAGPGGEVNGLLGTLTPVAAELAAADEQ